MTELQTIDTATLKPFFGAPDELHLPNATARLSENRRHAGRQQRRLMKVLNKTRAATSTIGQLPASDESIHCLLCGEYALFDFLPAVLALSGRPITELWIVTLGFSKANVTALGVMVPPPALKFSVHVIMPFSAITMAQIKLWSQVSNSQNAYPMLGFDAYELLFTGCTGNNMITSISQPGIEVIFNFQAEQNATGIAVGDITGIEKDGWDYMWVLFAKAVDPESNMLVTKPIAAYVEYVIPAVDLADALGIPDPDDGQEYSGPQYSE